MKLVYLFSDSKNMNEIDNYTYPNSKAKKAFETINVKKEIQKFDDSSVWILSFTTQKENQNAAELLSYINDDICRFNPTILHNGSASYFNKTIFPYINDFERKLRHFLYLKCSLYNDNLDNKSKIVLDELEKKDLGAVYELLFADKQMVKDFRTKVNERFSSKLYYQKILTDMSEKSIWNIVIGNNSNDYIKEHFLDIIDYRNDTMHAHNISFSEYIRQKKVFKKAISILDIEINKIIITPVSVETSETTVNTLLEGIIHQYLDNIPPSGYNSLFLNTDARWLEHLKQLYYQHDDTLKNANVVKDPQEGLFYPHQNIEKYIINAIESKEKNTDKETNEDKK